MNNGNLNNQLGQLYVVGPRGYSAYEVAVQNGYEGTEEEWLESLVGPEGPEGPQGEDGPVGPTGLTPALRVGSVTTGEPGTNAEVSIVGTPEIPIINFTIPKGAKGDTGDTGTTNYNDTTNKPQIGGVTLQGNRTLDELNIQPKGNYLTSSDLTDYVKNNDYAEWNKGGVVKTGNGFDLASNGIAQCGAVGYSSYQSKGNTYFISKGTLEAVFTGKGFLTEHQDLSNYVQKTQYGTGSTLGLMKPGYGLSLDAIEHKTQCDVMTITSYNNAYNSSFISKGTLENVLNSRIGSINSVLDAINGEVI